jgi:hypothetical protein
MATTAEVIEFSREDPSRVVAQMSALTAAGGGWINMGPGLTPEDFSLLPTRSTVAKWLSGRGPAVPMATWTPASRGRRPEPAHIGIAHGTGPHAVRRLEDDSIEVPTGWQKKQDHAKNGIVVELPESAPHEAVIAWLVRAMIALSPQIEIGEEWIAEVYPAD